MASSLWNSLARWIGSGGPGPGASGTGSGRRGGPELGWRLTSEVYPMQRAMTVPPQTVALIFEPDHPVRLALPGDRLSPSLIPSRRAVEVLVVNTAPVYLDVTVETLATLDRHPVTRCVVRLAVQLDDSDRYARLISLAREVGPGVEGHLLHRVRNEASAKIHAAVAMNRLADLHRLSVQQAVADRWLPHSFADGVLHRRDFAVLSLVSADDPRAAAAQGSGDEPRAAAVAEPPGSTAPAATAAGLGRADSPAARAAASAPAIPGLELTMDARLHRLWRGVVGSPLRGIAAASVEGRTTVVAVADHEPGAYEHSRLREEFGHVLDDPRVHLVATSAGSYADLVQAWFKQVDESPGRLLTVQSGLPGEPGSGNGVPAAALRVRVDAALVSPTERADGVLVGTPADREALRRLVPHARIEFVAAEPGGD